MCTCIALIVYKEKEGWAISWGFQPTHTKHIPQRNFSAKYLTPAEWERAAPKRGVPKDAFNCNFTDEFITLVADKSERLARQVEALRHDLVAVVRETRVFTGDRFLR